MRSTGSSAPLVRGLSLTSQEQALKVEKFDGKELQEKGQGTESHALPGHTSEAQELAPIGRTTYQSSHRHRQVKNE